jgi:hypothetical protein
MCYWVLLLLLLLLLSTATAVSGFGNKLWRTIIIEQSNRLIKNLCGVSS